MSTFQKHTIKSIVSPVCSASQLSQVFKIILSDPFRQLCKVAVNVRLLFDTQFNAPTFANSQ